MRYLSADIKQSIDLRRKVKIGKKNLLIKVLQMIFTDTKMNEVIQEDRIHSKKVQRGRTQARE